MTLTIPDTDHGKIRVFAVSDPVKGLEEREIEALVATFGNAPLNPDFVDVIDIEDLGDMDLAEYIATGYGNDLDAADQNAFARLAGVVVLIMSRAHEGVELTLSLADGVQHITTLGQGARMTIAAGIETEAAKGVVAAGGKPKKMSDARVGGMVATAALLFLFLLVGLMVWVGG